MAVLKDMFCPVQLCFAMGIVDFLLGNKLNARALVYAQGKGCCLPALLLPDCSCKSLDDIWPLFSVLKYHPECSTCFAYRWFQRQSKASPVKVIIYQMVRKTFAWDPGKPFSKKKIMAWVDIYFIRLHLHPCCSDGSRNKCKAIELYATFYLLELN